MKINDTDVVKKAYQFAKRAHSGQVRKGTNMPYISHPLTVFKILSRVTKNDKVLAAGLLHDVVEDTQYTLEDIRKKFGDDVAELVYWLTDENDRSVNRKERKNRTLLKYRKAPPEAQTIKLADIISNLTNITALKASFAPVYNAEKAEMVSVLKKGNKTLLKKAKELISDNEKWLEQQKKLK